MINRILNLFRNKKILLVLRLSITFCFLYYLLTKVSFSDIIASLRSSNFIFIIFATLLQICMRYIAAYQMKLLTSNQGLSLSTNKVFEINLITSFYELFLPSGISGGVIKWHKFSKHDNKKNNN